MLSISCMWGKEASKLMWNWFDSGRGGRNEAFVISCNISKWHSISAWYNSKGNKLTKLRMIICIDIDDSLSYPLFYLPSSVPLFGPLSLSRSSTLIHSFFYTHFYSTSHKLITSVPNEHKWFRFVPANSLVFYTLSNWYHFTCSLISNLGQHKCNP